MDIKTMQIQSEIMNILNKLDATDYKALKFVEGELTEEEFAPIKEQRKAWRAEINQLEKELEGLEE
jgi:uncharacterized membrane protein YgaE (UPF0421/DUF939 family)